MSVLLETTQGNIVIDLFTETQPRLCYNFLKLCKLNHYFFTPFYGIVRDNTIVTGNPRYPDIEGDISIRRLVDISSFDAELVGTNDNLPIESKEISLYEDNAIGLVSFLSSKFQDEDVVRSQFSICLCPNVKDRKTSDKQIPFGKIVEGFSVLEIINTSELESTQSGRLMNDIRILHTHIIHDPYKDPENLESHKSFAVIPNESQISHIRIPQFSELNEENIEETTYQALVLELMNDLPHYKIKPSPRTLFLAKLNPITTSDSLEIIFARFGFVQNVNVIKDPKTSKSLCYAFIEYSTKEEAEKAYFSFKKGCIIDGRNVIVDFSQSVRKS